MAKVYTPTDTTFSITDSITGIGTSNMDDSPVTDFPDRKTGPVTLDFTGSLSATAETDGIGESATADTKLQYDVGFGWTDIATVNATAGGVGGSDSDSDTGPFSIVITSSTLSIIALRVRTELNVNGSATSATGTGDITSWQATARPLVGGIISA